MGGVVGAGRPRRFPQLLGRQQAAWILLSSEWITGTEVHAMGLAWKLCEPDELLDVTYDHGRRHRA